MNAEIGGYFNLELVNGLEYHINALRLNCARSALHYILKAKTYHKIYLPHYICGCVLQPILAEHIEYEYYSINKNFEPIFDKEILDNECFLYVNYFGICDDIVQKVSKVYKNVIIDSTQAFYSKPETGIDTFYSARKFFGVSDGSYLYTDAVLRDPLERDISYARMEHLLKRIDCSANEGYAAFQESECSLNNSEIKEMSNLTRRVLSGVDYERCAKQRRENYLYLHQHLVSQNLLNLKGLGNQVPMVYPFYCDVEGLREALIENNIFIATYWNDVLEHVSIDSLETSFTRNLLALPIDQRYTVEEMEYIISSISEYLCLETIRDGPDEPYIFI